MNEWWGKRWSCDAARIQQRTPVSPYCAHASLGQRRILSSWDYCGAARAKSVRWTVCVPTANLVIPQRERLRRSPSTVGLLAPPLPKLPEEKQQQWGISSWSYPSFLRLNKQTNKQKIISLAALTPSFYIYLFFLPLRKPTVNYSA